MTGKARTSAAKLRGGRTATARPRPAAEPDYRALIEAAGDVIYTLDLQGRFTFVNSATVRVLGYPLDQVLGRSFTEFLTEEGAAVALQHFSRGLTRTEGTPFFEVEARRKSGGTVTLEVRAGGLYRDGVMIGRQGIARDISELKSLQAQVAEKSGRVSLLEERTRIAMSLYARIADLASAGDADPAASHDALREVHEAVVRVSAEKLGFNAADLRLLELLALGRSNREIAAEVHRSHHTIKDHVKKLMDRLGTRRRADTVAAALNLGLIARQ